MWSGTRNKAEIAMQAGKGVREGRRHRAQPVFLSPQVTPGDIRVPSETIPVPCGAQGTAGHKADATGTAWVVGRERCWHQGVSRGTWVRSHKGRASKRSPKSRPDHTPATINNVCAKVGGTERPSLEEARPMLKKSLFCMSHKADIVQTLHPYT